ncbi:MAG TPA: tetratricopeptide repeat protein [Kofleriaceae bacterium]|jgi:tetratricopeptide (TPR) repeat protein|nr:tetratricopeptide repeat protein [Kofleriaceae bacterium]
MCLPYGHGRGPRRRFWVLASLVLGVTGITGCHNRSTEHAADATLKFLPATLEVSRPRVGDPRIAKVRIYADPGVRALPHWKDDITDEVDYANQLLQPMLGVRLQIDAVKDWPRTGDPHAASRELLAADKGDDAAWVIGYVSPPDVASTAMTELGEAQPLGHHIIVRAWAERAETEALAGRLPDLKSGERADVLAAHRRHKQTVVLLHMLATTLGAIAEADSAWIQNVSYSPKQNTFANRTRELLQVAIDGRLSGDPDAALAKKLTDVIEKTEWGGWIPASHDEVVGALKHVTDAARAGRTFAGVPPAAFDELARITTLAKQGQLDNALAELANLLAAYPGNPSMHELKCEIMLGKPGIGDPATRAACAHVAELAPGDPTVHLAVGEALIHAGDAAGARAELAIAEDKIGNLNTGAGEAWRKVIALYAGLGALTWTEEAIAKAGLASDPAAAGAAMTRARYGIPRGARFVAPAREAALVAAIRGALDQVYASKFGDAERAIAAAEKQWPGAPGLTAARCDLAFRTGQIDAARATCARALAADPDDSWALYLEGVLLLRDAGTTPAGIEQLKHAIAVDPELAQAWRTLGKAYARGHDQPAFDQLDTAYRAKFGQALPP